MKKTLIAMILLGALIFIGCSKVTDPGNVTEKGSVLWLLEGDVNSQIKIECSSLDNTHTINKPDWMFMDEVPYGELISCNIKVADTSESGWIKLYLYVDGIKITSYINRWIPGNRSPGVIYLEQIVEKQ